jgi:hypothetical protein
MFPFYWSGYTGMQVAQVVHAAIALLMVGLIIGHIYIGTIGMTGAFEAMWSGRVDRNWAKEHHSLWYRQVEKAPPGTVPGVPARDAPVPRGAVASFGVGVVAAVAVALVMASIYGVASRSINERAASPTVHLDRNLMERPASAVQRQEQR